MEGQRVRQGRVVDVHAAARVGLAHRLVPGAPSSVGVAAKAVVAKVVVVAARQRLAPARAADGRVDIPVAEGGAGALQHLAQLRHRRQAVQLDVLVVLRGSGGQRAARVGVREARTV